MRPTHWLQLSLLALVWLGGSMAWTGEPDLQQEVTDLKEQLRTQQQQIADLQRQVGTNLAPAEKEMQPGATTPGDSDSPPPAKADNDFRLKFSWENGAVGETDDKAFRVHFGGRFDFDSTWYRAPANVQLQLDNPLLDGTEFRRFRFETDGTVWKQIEFKLEADFSRGEDFKSLDTSSPQTNIFITDAWLAINDLPLVGTVRIGHQKEYMTFANASSSNFYPFMERPFIFDAFEDDFSFDNGISMNRTYFDKQFTTWVGAFWTDTRSQAFNVGGQYAVTGRATWMPIDDETKQQWLNFGVSGSDRALASTGESISVRPLVRAGQSFNVPDLIDTATIFSADGLQIRGAGVHG